MWRDTKICSRSSSLKSQNFKLNMSFLHFSLIKTSLWCFCESGLMPLSSGLTKNLQTVDTTLLVPLQFMRLLIRYSLRCLHTFFCYSYLSSYSPKRFFQATAQRSDYLSQSTVGLSEKVLQSQGERSEPTHVFCQSDIALLTNLTCWSIQSPPPKAQVFSNTTTFTFDRSY